MNARHQISCVDENIFVNVFIIKTIEILGRRIFNVNIGKLILKAFIVYNVLPVITFVKNSSWIECSDLIFVWKFNNTVFDIIRIFLVFDKVLRISNQQGREQLQPHHSQLSLKAHLSVWEFVIISTDDRTANDWCVNMSLRVIIIIMIL